MKESNQSVYNFSQQPLNTRGLLLAYLIPERGCFNLVNAGGGLASLTKKAPQQEFQNPLTFVSLGSTPCEPNAF